MALLEHSFHNQLYTLLSLEDNLGKRLRDLDAIFVQLSDQKKLISQELAQYISNATLLPGTKNTVDLMAEVNWVKELGLKADALSKSMASVVKYKSDINHFRLGLAQTKRQPGYRLDKLENLAKQILEANQALIICLTQPYMKETSIQLVIGQLSNDEQAIQKVQQRFEEMLSELTELVNKLEQNAKNTSWRYKKASATSTELLRTFNEKSKQLREGTLSSSEYCKQCYQAVEKSRDVLESHRGIRFLQPVFAVISSILVGLACIAVLPLEAVGCVLAALVVLMQAKFIREKAITLFFKPKTATATLLDEHFPRLETPFPYG